MHEEILNANECLRYTEMFKVKCTGVCNLL